MQQPIRDRIGDYLVQWLIGNSVARNVINSFRARLREAPLHFPCPRCFVNGMERHRPLIDVVEGPAITMYCGYCQKRYDLPLADPKFKASEHAETVPAPLMAEAVDSVPMTNTDFARFWKG